MKNAIKRVLIQARLNYAEVAFCGKQKDYDSERCSYIDPTMDAWVTSNSYGAYIVHLLLMIALQNAVDGIWMGAFGKFMFIGVAITIASFGLTWLLRRIPGVKKIE